MQLPTIVDSWLWPAFIGSVIFLLLLDLFVFHRTNKSMAVKEAMGWSVFWIALALGFNFWFSTQYGGQLGLEFLTGYLVELSLSVDNLFVILLVFKSFRVQPRFQHRVLFWGIMGAVFFRAVLIIVGVDLIHKFEWIMYVFGAILVYSAAKFLFETDEEQDVTDNWAVRQLKRFVPMTQVMHGDKFWVLEDGVRKATPMFAALVVVEVSDIIFAVDSIPAVLAVTQDAFVAFASNILAILGLRSLYFVMADWVGKFRYLKPGLATVLGFIGIKMLIMDFYKIPSWVSLLVIVFVLITAGLSSWYVDRRSILAKGPKGNAET